MPKLAGEVREERRRRLLDSAWRCATRTRFREVTVDDVCEEAGVSKGAFYGYFSSKQELLLALLEDDARQLDQLLDELAESKLDSGERLRLFTKAILEQARDAGSVQVRADLWTAMLTEPEVRSRFVAAVDRRRQRLRRWIEEGIASQELAAIPGNAFASILLALADGLMLHASAAPSAFKWRNIESALDVLLGGISVHPGGPA